MTMVGLFSVLFAVGIGGVTDGDFLWMNVAFVFALMFAWVFYVVLA